MKEAFDEPGRAGPRGRRADEVGGVDLNLLAVLGAHLLERRLGLMKEVRVLDVAEADAAEDRTSAGCGGGPIIAGK